MRGGANTNSAVIYDEQKKYEDLDFTDDFIFCKVMTHNPDICEEMLSLILGREVELTKTEKQMPIEITSDGHGVRFDVYSEDDVGNKYDIEMQVVKRPEIARRSRYYQSMIDLDMLEKGMTYNELKDGYVIFICTFDPIGDGLARYRFENMCEEMPGKKLGDGAYKIFLNTTAIDVEKTVELKALFEYINHREAVDKFTRKLDGLVSDARKNKNWRLEYMTLFERDRENREAGIAEGIERGRAEGMTEGLNIKDRLFKCMQQDDRLDEYARSVDDPGLFEVFAREYGLMSEEDGPLPEEN